MASSGETARGAKRKADLITTCDTRRSWRSHVVDAFVRHCQGGAGLRAADLSCALSTLGVAPQSEWSLLALCEAMNPTKDGFIDVQPFLATLLDTPFGVPAAPPMPSATDADAQREPRDWQDREKVLKTWMVKPAPISISWAMRCAIEAADAICHDHALGIIEYAARYIHTCCNPALVICSGERNRLSDDFTLCSHELQYDFHNALNEAYARCGALELVPAELMQLVAAAAAALAD